MAPEDADRSICEQLVEKHLRNSPLVGFLLDAVRRAGAPLDGTSIRCQPCAKTAGSGSFDPPTTITVCQDAIQSTGHVEDVLAHELIHAYDYWRVDFDMNNCRQRACTEIRAANLSGDCRWTRELARGWWRIRAQHRACVQRRAILSLRDADACRECDVERVVADVLDSCISDTAPFIDVP